MVICPKVPDDWLPLGAPNWGWFKELKAWNWRLQLLLFSKRHGEGSAELQLEGLVRRRRNPVRVARRVAEMADSFSPNLAVLNHSLMDLLEDSVRLAGNQIRIFEVVAVDAGRPT